MTYPARVAEPGQAFSWTDGDGVEQTMEADAKGIVTPTDPQGQAVADSHGLPEAKATKSAKAEEE